MSLFFAIGFNSFSGRFNIFIYFLFFIFNLNKSPLGETGCLSNPYFLRTGFLGIQLFDSPFSQHSQLGYLLVTYSSLCNTCMTYRTPCHSIDHQVLPILTMCLCAHTYNHSQNIWGKLLVFMWNSEIQETFNFYFSAVFCYYQQNFFWGGRLSAKL